MKWRGQRIFVSEILVREPVERGDPLLEPFEHAVHDAVGLVDVDEVGKFWLLFAGHQSRPSKISTFS